VPAPNGDRHAFKTPEVKGSRGLQRSEGLGQRLLMIRDGTLIVADGFGPSSRSIAQTGPATHHRLASALHPVQTQTRCTEHTMQTIDERLAHLQLAASSAPLAASNTSRRRGLDAWRAPGCVPLRRCREPRALQGAAGAANTCRLTAQQALRSSP